MDTNRIRYFLSLAQTGSISKAADLHRISPPAFSKAMKIFEKEVSRTLTVPQGRGLVLTDEAKLLVPKLTAILHEMDAIVATHADVALSGQRLRIGTFEVFSTYFMGRTISEFFPDAVCEIRELIPGRMEEAVAGGLVDLAITYLPIPHPDLDYLHVLDVEMGVFGRDELISSHQVEDIPFAVPINPIEGSPNKVRGLDGWPDDAYPRKVQFRVQMLETALAFSRAGRAAVYIPKFLATLHNETVRERSQLKPMSLPRKFPKRRDAVYLIKRKSDLEGVSAKRLAHALRKLCRG